MSHINSRIEPIREASKSAICLYDSAFNPITFRNFRCEYCSEIRKIKELKEACDKCDRNALQSDADHDYECPFGLIKAVMHIPLKNGAMHAIMGKRRYKSNELAAEKLREAIAKGASLNFDRMIKAYEEIPFPEQDDFEEHFLSLKKTLQTLRDEEWLDSFENETVLQTIGFLRQTESLHCFDFPSLLHWSESSLNRIFWKMCRERFFAFIRERKMILAEDRLTNTDESIIKIAKELNYNFMYFQTLFKSFCSITPNDFRRHGFRGPHPPHLPF